MSTLQVNTINESTSASGVTVDGVLIKDNTVDSVPEIDLWHLTADRAMITNGSGKIAISAVTSTEVGYLDGVTSSIQTQLNNKITTGSLSLASLSDVSGLTQSIGDGSTTKVPSEAAVKNYITGVQYATYSLS